MSKWDFAPMMNDAQKAASLMATEGLASLSPAYALNVIEAHLEARPDLAHGELRQLAQHLDRLADKLEREAPLVGETDGWGEGPWR